ncbi:MAG: hypothetical protein ACKPAE_21940 [Microcystis panniformis]
MNLLSLLFTGRLRRAFGNTEKGGGIFLWHYPHAHAHWTLSSKCGLSGVRTFLGIIDKTIPQPLDQLSPIL